GVAPLDSVLVRRALAMATDRPALIKSIWRGIGGVANSPAWPNDPYFANVQEPGYNPSGAQKLLKEYGRPVSITILSTNDPTEELEAQALQEMWQAVGMHVILASPEEAGTQSENVIDKKYEAAIFGFPPFLDPDQWWSLIWQPQGVLNVDNYHNSVINTALARGGELAGLSERKAEYTVVQRQLANEVYALFLHYTEEEAAVRSDVHGLDQLTLPDGAKAPYGQEYGVPFSVESMWLSS
ncbi:MAG TPA: ABC transporter substrate-binding protein, partial [Acidimicrobiales bacterium]|nr:ABC transporter substrate-binding protein [Acidimicrobiales bacterium]